MRSLKQNEKELLINLFNEVEGMEPEAATITKADDEAPEAMYTVKDLADELGLTPYKARVALRKAFGKAKGRWQWDSEEEYQAALDAVGGAK